MNSNNKYVFGVNYGPKPTVPSSSSSLSGMGHILKTTATKSPTAKRPNSGMGLLNLSNSAKDAILGAVQHPRSYARIQEIEAPKPPPQEVPDLPQQVRKRLDLIHETDIFSKNITHISTVSATSIR